MLISAGRPLTTPTRSSIIRNAEERRRDVRPISNRSRITSDFETFRWRDSASISAANCSGRRTVSVFIHTVYYTHGNAATQRLPSILIAVDFICCIYPRPSSQRVSSAVFALDPNRSRFHVLRLPSPPIAADLICCIYPRSSSQWISSAAF